MWVGLGWRTAACGLSVAALLLVGGCSAHKAETEAAEANEELLIQQQRAAALEHSLQQRTDELAATRADLDKARAREQELSAALKRALRVKLGVAEPDSGRHAGDVEAATASAQFASLRDELARERQRCRSLEEQLARGAEKPQVAAPVAEIEASPPCAGGGAAAESLRAELQRERDARRKLLAEVRSVEGQGSSTGSPSLAAENRALRARLIDLEARRQDDAEDLARRLRAQRAGNDSENTACAPTVAALAPSTVREEVVEPSDESPSAETSADDDAEVARLRKELDAERHQNARLTAKLKVAGRVTELIFKMQQQGGAQPETAMPLLPPPAEPSAALE